MKNKNRNIEKRKTEYQNLISIKKSLFQAITYRNETNHFSPLFIKYHNKKFRRNISKENEEQPHFKTDIL